MFVPDSPRPVGILLKQADWEARYGQQSRVTVERPLIYRGQVDDHTGAFICNAIDPRKRIPVDELRDMVADLKQRQKAKGADQMREDHFARIREGWGEILQAEKDRQRGRVLVGAYTFTNTRHKGT